MGEVVQDLEVGGERPVAGEVGIHAAAGAAFAVDAVHEPRLMQHDVAPVFAAVQLRHRVANVQSILGTDMLYSPGPLLGGRRVRMCGMMHTCAKRRTSCNVHAAGRPCGRPGYPMTQRSRGGVCVWTWQTRRVFNPHAAHASLHTDGGSEWRLWWCSRAGGSAVVRSMAGRQADARGHACQNDTHAHVRPTYDFFF